MIDSNRRISRPDFRRQTKEGRKYRTDNVTAGGLSGGGYTYEWNGVTKLWRMPIERMKELDD
jgi:site-specific DNA-methyltransferase (adenine-specific)